MKSIRSILEVKYRIQNVNGNWTVQEGTRHYNSNGSISYRWKIIFSSLDFLESFNTMRIMCAVSDIALA